MAMKGRQNGAKYSGPKILIRNSVLVPSSVLETNIEDGLNKYNIIKF